MDLSKDVPHVKHIILPGYEQARLELLEGESISAFLERSEWNFALQTICVKNGVPVLRTEWNTTEIAKADNVLFVSRPYGGGQTGNKAMSVAAIVAMVSIAAFAPWAAGTLLGLAQGTFGYYAAVAGITLAGGYLVSTFLIPKPANNDQPAPAQLFTLTGGGNTATPFQSIPVQYGRLKLEPVYAALPWSDYLGNDQYINIVLCLGLGKYSTEQILMDDTVIWDSVLGDRGILPDWQFKFCDPGENFTLFPLNVVTSTEVSGQELVNTTPIGFFVASPPTTSAYEIVVDFLFPAGAQATDGGDGHHFNIDIHLFVEIQQVDDAGSPISGIFTVYDEVLSYNTNQPIRVSVPVVLADHGLPNGRYQVRVHRNPGPAPDTEHNVDTVVWVQLRANLVTASSFENVSILGLRVKATGVLSGSGSKRFGVIQTRILPVWNGSAFVDTPTQNAFWAFYDCATNELYGAQWPISKVDFQTIVDQAAAATSRGDTFNYKFDSAVTFQEAFDTILASNRAKTCFLGDVLSCVRDEWHTVPQMLISDQQIIRGSLEVDYIINDDSNTDCVQMQFLNEDTWNPAMLQFPKNNSPTFVGTRPAQLQIQGLTKPAQVWRELQFWYNQSSKRRIKVRLDTEHDGRILHFGSVIALNSHLPKKWGVNGEVVSYNSGTKVLTLDRDLTADIGQYYIELRDKRGRYFGPVKAGLTAIRQVTLDSTDLAAVEGGLGTTIVDALDRMDGAEPPSFVWGISSELSRHCIVMSGRPDGDKVSLEMVVDYETVHNDSDPDAPPIPEVPSVQDPRVPIITSLVANFTQGVVEPRLTASWWPAKGALYYRAQVSYDGGASWIGVSDNLQDPQLTAIVSFSDLRLRVAGVGFIQGPWTTVDVTAPNLNIQIPINARNLEAGLHDYVMNQLKTTQSDISQVIQQVASFSAEHDGARTTGLNQLRSSLKAVGDGVSAEVSTLSSVVADNESAFAAYQVTVATHFASTDANVTTNATAISAANGSIASLSSSVSASFASTNANVASNTASITTNATAIATTNGVVAALFTLTLDVNGYVTGFVSTNNGVTSNFQVIADKFVVAKPGVSGGGPLTVFQISTVGGVASIAFSGSLYADGSIHATALSVTQLDAVTANMGTLTAGKIQSADTKFTVDCTNKQIIISD